LTLRSITYNAFGKKTAARDIRSLVIFSFINRPYMDFWSRTLKLLVKVGYKFAEIFDCKPEPAESQTLLMQLEDGKFPSKSAMSQTPLVSDQRCQRQF
jgi:hypothetical protein